MNDKNEYGFLVSKRGLELFKKRIFFLVSFFFILLFMEACSYVALKRLQPMGFIYSPPKIHRDEYENYLRERNGNLGWGDLTFRPAPAYSDSNKYQSCFSMYGDSFVYGHGVSDEDTVANVLSKLLHCRVSNYGVDGYGSDQAYLQFHNNIKDNSKIVILGYLTENILRNVNRYRYCLYAASCDKFGLKPRFIVDKEGQLRLIPLPHLSYDDFVRAINNPGKYLEQEFFVPGNIESIARLRFPYTFTFVKTLIKSDYLRNRILGFRRQKSFYDTGHPSNALMVTSLIMNKFCIEAEGRNKIPIILIIPTGWDLVYYKHNKRFVYENLTKQLKENNIRFVDVGPGLIARLNGKDPAELFLRHNINEHLNAEGNKLLAKIVYDYLKENKLSW